MSAIEPLPDKLRLQAKLSALSEEISADLSRLEEAESKELLSDFVSELFLAAADRRRRTERRQRQAEGIAAAKAKGVRFGRAAKPLPDNFEEVRQMWRRGECTLQQAADACGMPRGTFYSASARAEKAG